MKIFEKIMTLTISLLFIGCTEVINVDLNTTAPKLVIDASIDWVKNTTGNKQKIKLSTTTGYYSPEFPTVSGATVVVTNSTKTVFNFVETLNTGEYICTNFDPTLGETYTLTIALNGEIYTATETLIGTPNIENTIEQNNTGGLTGNQIEINFKHKDNGQQDNYYLTSVTTKYISFPHYRLQNDKFSQGNEISEDYSHKDLKQGDLVNLKLYGISKRYYEYFNKLSSATADGGPFPTIPTLIKGNILNQTNSTNYALGFFRLSEITTKDYIIQ